MRDVPLRSYSISRLCGWLGLSHPRSLVWLALYPLAWVLLSSLSTSYWFLPAGLRIAVMWQLPHRAWLPVAVLEIAGVAGYHLIGGTWDNPGALAASAALPWIASAAAVAWCRPRASASASLGSQLPALAGCGFLASLAGGLLVEAAAALDGGAGLDSGVFYGVAQASFTGFLIVGPLLLALIETVNRRNQDARAFLAHGQVLFPGAALLLGAGLPLEYPVSFALALALSALFWLALRQGWRATCVAMVGLVLAVCTSDVLMEGWIQPRMQLLIASSAVAAVLLGAATDAMRVQGHALHLGLAQLHRRSSELADAAKRLATVQERERRTLGTELHDVVGQDITAIATRLRVVERTTSDPEVRKGLHSISQLVGDAHQHLREVVEHMYPAVLDRFGLSRALCEGPLAQLALDGGLDYHCEITRDLPYLPPDVATSIYRICQEVTSNCVRHEACSSMRIVITLERSATRHSLVVATRDDGGRIELGDARHGMGLQNIRDRANALGALYQFDAARGEPRHWLSLSLEWSAAIPSPAV